MPELAECWVEVVWLGSRRWWPSSVARSFAVRPVLSRAAHAFRNAAVAAACKVAAEDAFHCLTTGGGDPKHKLEHSVSASTSYQYFWCNVYADAVGYIGGLPVLDFLCLSVHALQLKKICKDGAYWGNRSTE